jgi:hypothetical protein
METDIDSNFPTTSLNSDSTLRDTYELISDLANEGEDHPLPPLFKSSSKRLLFTWNLTDLVGRTFKLPEVDGISEQTTIKECIDKYARTLSTHPELIRFKCTVNDKEMDNLISYGQIMKSLEPADNDSKRDFKVDKTYAHRGPLKPSDFGYLGSSYNLMVRWQSGRESTEPLTAFIGTRPIDVFLYTKANIILNARGWLSVSKRKEVQPLLSPEDKDILSRPQAPAPSTNLNAKPSVPPDFIPITVGEHHAVVEDDMTIVNKAKISSGHHNPIFMYGVQVPRNHLEAMRLELENKNTKWQDAERAELDSIFSYQAFKDIGHVSSAKPPKDHKKITVHMVYAVKHTVWNAYLESVTKEKVCTVAGPEFASHKLQGHILTIYKALYGLKSSGLR